MPLKRTRRYKRRRGRRSNYRRKTLPLYKNINTGQLSIKQKTFEDITIPILPAGTDYTQLLTFKLNPVSQSFPQIFDQFRINAVKCTFWAVNNLPGGTTNNKNVILYTSIDLDGQNNLPINETEMLFRSNVKQRIISFGGGNPQFHTHLVKPRTAGAVYNGLTTTGYGLSNRKMWLDIRSSIDAPHYGMIMQVAAPEGINTFTLRVQYTYYLQFRKVI